MTTYTFALDECFAGKAVGTNRQTGASLIVVMMILIIVAILGVGGAQIAFLAERSARSDRDLQLAFQSAEATLSDAINDMEGVGTPTRKTTFSPTNQVDFLEGCGATGVNKGLCLPTTIGKPMWLAINLASSTSNSTEFGEFTGSNFAAGVGVGPAKKPRYITEVIGDTWTQGTDLSLTAPSRLLYRVTAMGFGPRDDSQAVVQILYSKE